MTERSAIDEVIAAIDELIREIGRSAVILRFGVCLSTVACAATLIHAYVATEFQGASLPWLILRTFDSAMFYVLARFFWKAYEERLVLLALLRQERFDRARRRAPVITEEDS